MADPTLAQPEGADADPATAATRPAKSPRVLLQMPVNVRSVSLVVLATRPAALTEAGPGTGRGERCPSRPIVAPGGAAGSARWGWVMSGPARGTMAHFFRPG